MYKLLVVDDEKRIREGMAAAVRALSPVSMMIRSKPRSRKLPIASETPAFKGSSMPITPTSTPSTAR